MTDNTFSTIIDLKQIRAIEKVGDLMVPQTEDFPSFSQLGCVEYIDDVLSYAPPEELSDLKMLLSTLNSMPEVLLKQIISLMYDNRILPDAIANTVRLVDTGLRGIIFTLYYSGKKGKNYLGKTPLEIIGYDINRV